MSNIKTSAIIVSYNRLALLKKCLHSLSVQTLLADQIVVVDNASTDGTREWLQEWERSSHRAAQVILNEENLGGAGGFVMGLEAAIKNGADWIWMMDDDAAPHPTALEELIKIADNPDNIYGSLATNGANTSWLMTLLGEPSITTKSKADIPPKAEVQMLPFLGFLIHKNLVKKIGLPDPGFFIAADDVEYCLRAQRAGAKIIVAGNSHIEHPASYPYIFRLPGYTLTCLKLPPWKRYYDTRNRILIAKRHYGFKLYSQTIPASFIRMLATLIHEPDKLVQLKAFAAGMIDGLLNRTGRRHDKWALK